MFIIRRKDGSELTGAQMTWDKVETTEDNYITSLQLTLPFRAHAKTDTGEIVELPARTISVGPGYNKYYYGKEAVTGFGQNGGVATNDVAEIIGGIDLVKEECVQIRVAREGNITVNRFPLNQLEHHEHSHRLGRPKK